MFWRQKAERKGIHCVCRTCVADIACLVNSAQRFFLFSYLDFHFYFVCCPPESFKTICLTCIWSKFIDTSFHLRKARNKVLAASTRFSQLIIAGLHEMSRRTCCWCLRVKNKSISLLWEPTIFMHILREKILLYWPPTHHKHGRLVTWLQAKNCVKQERIIITTDRWLELAT